MGLCLNSTRSSFVCAGFCPLSDRSNVSWSMNKNETFYYFFCELCFNIHPAVCFQLMSQPNYKKCNMFRSSSIVVYLLGTEWNKIFTMWDGTGCDLKWLLLSTELITLMREGNPSRFMVGEELKTELTVMCVREREDWVDLLEWMSCIVVIKFNTGAWQLRWNTAVMD